MPVAGWTTERRALTLPVAAKASRLRFSGRTRMDFIESLFGIAPDNGDGSLEALWVGALVVAVLAVAFRHRIAARFFRKS
jgi:hypothetical protein